MNEEKYIAVCSARQKHGVCHSKFLASFDTVDEARNYVVKDMKGYAGAIDCEITDYSKYEVFEDSSKMYGIVYDILKIRL